MANQFDHYQITSADWRKTLRQNQHRTYFVMIIFILIYASIGLLVDLYVYTGTYPDTSISQILHALLTFQLFPTFTVILAVVAFFTIMICYAMYDKLMLLGTDYYEVTPQSARNLREKQLYNVVDEMRIASGLRYTPKVYVINADYMNAFASGYSEKSAMIAITQGLLEKLNRDELQAVMAHELSHIRHLDIKITLTATLLANITLMVIDMLFYNMLFSNRGRDSRGRNGLVFVIILLRYLLPLVNIILLFYLSRKRELMADAGCVELMRANQPLASALLKIQNDHVNNADKYNQEYGSTPHESVRRQAYIFDPLEAGINSVSSFSDLFSTHPSIQERLKALGFKKLD